MKSDQREEHIQDLAETFARLCKANLKLSPEKCVFGVHKGKVLGCLVPTKGVEANLDKIKAIRIMEEPKSRKDVQKLTGRIAALNRFMSKSAKRSLPFFKVLRGAEKLEWGPEKSKAFAELKDHLEKMAILVTSTARGTSLDVYCHLSINSKRCLSAGG